MTFKKILCPFDFSEPARSALQRAVELAKSYHATLTVLHVVQPIVYPVEYGLAPPHAAEFESQARDNALKGLDEALATYVEGVDVTTRVELGLPARTICDIAEDEGVDLIVIATRGLSGLQHFLLGSTTERVVRIARCPVLTIKAQA